MRTLASAVLLAGLAVPVAAHPVESVIELLQKLSTQVETEHKNEEVTYTKFEYWCQNSKKTLAKAIGESESKIDQLGSEIESHAKNIEVLQAGIEAHDEELTRLASADSSADEQRGAAKGLYDEESAALGSTIEAIGEAIDALVAAKGTTDGGFLLAQQRTRAILAFVGSRATPTQFAALQRFADEPRPDVQAKGDYEGHVDKYSFKSGSVIDLLKQLKLKFEDELTASHTAETNSLNAHELAKSAREDARTAATESKTTKLTEKGDAETAKATAEGDLGNAQGDLEADKSALEETEKACDVKKSEWAERSQTRTQEKKAIDQAVKILAKVTGVRTEAPENPVLPPSPVEAEDASADAPGLLQKKKDVTPAQKALNLIRTEAEHEHSKALEHLADVLAARLTKKGAFDDVINMIQKLIFREMHEQKEEDEHKAWCDVELNRTNNSLDDEQTKIDELALKIEAHKATANVLLTEMSAADEMVNTINAHIEEATEIRKVGKEENRLAKKDAEDAQVALANAIAVLKDFYKSSGQVPKESWEFLQNRVQSRIHAPVELPETPSTWDSSYTGVADPTNQPEGILAVLETISADFARMSSETQAQENTDQQAYDEDMKRCKIEKARRAKESEMKTQERKRILEKQASMEENHKNVKGEWEATEQYFKDLQPACVEGDSTYEDRKAARETTIQALKQAQEILQSEATTTTSSPSFLQLRGSRRA